MSGGPDSTALLHLVAAWRPPTLAVHVATVDHGLRPAARHEAEAVVEAASSLGLPASILRWDGEKPSSRLQERARAARYDMLFRAARACGASHVVTAHTRDDQAETVLMRLADGSGPRGLSGIRPQAEREGLVLSRPLLGVSKATLVALCQERNWPFATDPGNGDPRFARARWRALAPALAAEGLTTERMARLAARLRRADAALDAAATAAAAACADTHASERHAYGATLFGVPDEILLRVIDAALRDTAPAAAVRLAKLEALADALRAARRDGVAIRRTLQGCLVALSPAGRLVITREPRRRGPTKPLIAKG